MDAAFAASLFVDTRLRVRARQHVAVYE